MTYLSKAKELYSMIEQGKMMDAFEKFYHEEVVMHEATGEIREGKDTNRKFEQEWMASIQEMHGGGVGSIASDEENGVTTVESWIDVSFKNGQRYKMEEVAVQQWKDGQIIHERFYYNPPSM